MSGVQPKLQPELEEAASFDGSAFDAVARWGNRLSLPLVCLTATGICLPFLHIVWWMCDEGILLHAAQRMLRGDKLYADFFEFLPPGGFVLTEAWLGVAGASFASARWLLVLTVAGTAGFTFLACRLASKNSLLSAVLTIAWMVLSPVTMLQLNHHWLTTLFSMVAGWATLAGVAARQRRLRWPLIAGTAVGMASMVVSTDGALVALAGLAAFLSRRRGWAEPIAYLLATAVVPLCLLANVVAQHTLAAAFDEVILWPARHYMSINRVPFGFDVLSEARPLEYLFPFAGLLTLIVAALDRRNCLRNPLLWTCVTFGVAGFIGCLSRPDMHHIAFGAPLVCPLFAYCLDHLTQRWRPIYRYVVVAVVIELCLPAARLLSWSMQYAIAAPTVPSPRGDVVFYQQPGAAQMLARIVATPPNDAYFFYPWMTLLPFLTAREDVAAYDIFAPGYTPPSEYQDACQAVMQHALWVVIDRNWTSARQLKDVFPLIKDVRPPEMQAFEQALDEGFDLVAKDGMYELRHRRDGVNDSLCAGIVN